MFAVLGDLDQAPQERQHRGYAAGVEEDGLVSGKSCHGGILKKMSVMEGSKSREVESVIARVLEAVDQLLRDGWKCGVAVFTLA